MTVIRLKYRLLWDLLRVWLQRTYLLHSIKASSENSEALGLEHRVYLPDSGGSAADIADTPVVILVHGRAGNDTVMWLFSKVLEKLKPVVFAPQAPLADPIGGYSWWLVDEAPEELSGSPRKTSLDNLDMPLAKLEEFILKLPSVYEVSLSQVYAFGFSQGAALLASLSLLNPQLFKAVALLAGFLPSAVVEQIGREDVEKLPACFVAHGTEDEVIPLSAAQSMAETLRSFGADVDFHSEQTAHKIGSRGMKGLGEWFDRVSGD